MGADVGLWIVQAGLSSDKWTCIAQVSQDDEDQRYPGVRFITPEEQAANARLIAAAPDLLEALKEAREALTEAQRADSIIGTAIVSAEVNLSMPYGAAILIIEARESVAREIARIDTLLSELAP